MAVSLSARLSALFFFLALAFAAQVAVDPTATISAGAVIGTKTRPANQPSLTASANAYLGLPFAKSPPQRFSPPQPASPWSTPLRAQTIKPACIQQFTASGRSQELTKQFFNNPNGPILEESEDCLYLNIYTPSDAAPGSKKAVMFWLHGVRCLLSKNNDTSLTIQGNLQFGSGGYQYFDGSSLAITQNVIVVNINYRTNSMSTFHNGCPKQH